MLLLKEELQTVKVQCFCETGICKNVDWISQGQTAVGVNHQRRPWVAQWSYWGAWTWEIRKQIFELCFLNRPLWTYHLRVIGSWIMKMSAFVFCTEWLWHNELMWIICSAVLYGVFSTLLESLKLRTRYFNCVTTLCMLSQNGVGKKYCSLKVSEPWGFLHGIVKSSN